MTAAALLAALGLWLSADIVHLKSSSKQASKKVEGRILDFGRFIEVEQPDGRRTRVLKAEIERIEIAPHFIHSPELQPFPIELLEKQTEYQYVSLANVLVALPKPPGRKVLSIDFATGKKLWEADVPNRLGEPVLAGRSLLILQREKFLDDSKKIKVGGALYAKEINKLTLTALDLETGATQWTQVFDNNDRRDILWEFTGAVPQLWVLPDTVVVAASKIGYPMDRTGSVDKGQSKRFVTFYTYDSTNKRLLDTADSPDAADATAPGELADDAIVFPTYESGRSRLVGVGYRDGKLRWKSEEMTGRVRKVVGDQAYVAVGNHLHAYSLQTGKRLEKWSVELTGGEVADIDENFVYFYRKNRAPRGLFAYDVRKAEEAFRIAIDDREQINHNSLVGHRLLYTDRTATLHAFDTVLKKELWAFSSPGTGNITRLFLIGSTLTFYKDRRLYHVDINTGDKIWELRGDFTDFIPAGDAGLVARRFQTAAWDIIREFRPPQGAVFFTMTGTALRHVTGEESWSVPAFGKDMLYSLSSSGYLLAFDVKAREIKKLQKVSPTPIPAPVPPLLLGEGRLAVSLNNQTHVLDPAGDAKHFQVQHIPVRPDRQAWVLEKGFLAGGGSLALVESETGRKLWEVRARPLDHILAGGKLYGLFGREIREVDLQSGETSTPIPSVEGGNTLAVEGGKIFVAAGPYRLTQLIPDEEPQVRFKAVQQDSKIAIHLFRGSLVSGGGKLYYSHSDGEILCLNAATGKPLWTVKTPQYTSPLLLHGPRLWYAAPGQGLFGINAATGVVEWKLLFPEAAGFTPFVRDGKVAFWSTEGWLVSTE